MSFPLLPRTSFKVQPAPTRHRLLPRRMRLQRRLIRVQEARSTVCHSSARLPKPATRDGWCLPRCIVVWTARTAHLLRGSLRVLPPRVLGDPPSFMRRRQRCQCQLLVRRVATHGFIRSAIELAGSPPRLLGSRSYLMAQTSRGYRCLFGISNEHRSRSRSRCVPKQPARGRSCCRSTGRDRGTDRHAASRIHCIDFQRYDGAQRSDPWFAARIAS